MKHVLLSLLLSMFTTLPAFALLPEEKAEAATNSIFPLVQSLGIEKEELLQLCLEIETKLQKDIQEQRSFQLPFGTRVIEYDDKTGHLFIHLGKGGTSLIEQGYYKKITRSILYHHSRPELVANCRGSLSDINDLKITKKLQGLPGIVEARAFITHRTKNRGVEIVLKHYNAHSLRTIFNKQTYSFSVDEKITIAKDILRGLTSLHRKGYVHRDLHTGNFLVEVKGAGARRKVNAVITDFGKTMRMKKCRGISSQAAHEYRGPEAIDWKELKGKDYVATDIYAAGCVLYRLYFEKDPPWFSERAFFARKGLKTRRELMKARSKSEAIISDYTQDRRLFLERKVWLRQATKEERFEYMILSMMHPNPEQRKSAARWRDFIR